MMAHTYLLALLVLGLSCLQSVVGLAVAVSQISCTRLYFTLTLTTAEIRGAANLGVLIGGNIVSEVGLSGSFTTTNSAEFYAAFFDGSAVTSGATPVTFALLDTDDTALPNFAPVVQTLTFQCGTVITTSARLSSATATSASASAAATSSASNGGSTSNSNNNGGGTSSGSNSSSTSSGSSSNTGAIAGGVVGGLAALAAIALIAFCMIRKKKRANSAGRLRHDEVDEAAFRGPNNHSNASLATAPETQETPMMRDISTKNVFADPTASGTSGAPSGASGASSSHVGGAAAGAAAAGGIGAAAIAARKQSREEARARSSSLHSDRSPSSEDVPPPVPAVPAAGAYSAKSSAAPTQPVASTSTPAYPSQNRSALNPSSQAASSAAAATTAAAVGAAAGESKGKNSKWGFKRGSQDKSAAAAPAPPAAESSGATPADAMSLASTTPSYASAGGSESPSRSFNVIHKPPPAPYAMAGPSNKSFTPSENSGSRKPFAQQRSGLATPPGSVRGNANSRAPSVASMSAGFADAPPLPSSASVASAPVSESGNMAGVGAGRAYNVSSGNSTKWHQQSYNIMPNFSARAMPRSTQLEEDLIFGHLGMGLTSPTMPSAGNGNGSETGSSKSRRDPFGDR